MVYQHSKESLPPQFKTSPGESNLVPQESWNSSPQAVSLSPVDSGSLSSQSTNASPGFIQRVISLPGYNWVILSQKPRKERPRRSLLIPSEVYQHFQHNKGIPSKLPSISQQSTSLPTEYCSPARLLEYFSPHRVIHSPSLFPNGVIFSYRYSCNHHPQRKRRISLFNISPGFDFPASVKDIFSQTKIHS